MDELERAFLTHTPNIAEGFFSLRVVRESSERWLVRRGVLEPPKHRLDAGLMVTAFVDGGLGYAASADLSERGVRLALREAEAWACHSAGRAVVDTSALVMPHPKGEVIFEAERPWANAPLEERLELLREASDALAVSELIVDREAELWHTDVETLYLTNRGGRLFQCAELLCPGLSATAARDGRAQRRSTRHGVAQRGGLEVLDRVGFSAVAGQLAEEAARLLDAEPCPSGVMDLVLAPDQMMLQIHESIGHPLELDRILGDERNYAGTSFVTLDMFGSYRYGSDLLNVTFDPTVPEELASYGYDDTGLEAERAFVIEEGVLVRPLGGALSQHRAGLHGTANARATSWNRPPIDRMANLNLEPGEDSLESLIAGVERGVLMRTNRSWSIDDSRNKFQFGCELGERIEDGRLVGLVRDPNYRGVSASFWRSLDGVGDRSTFEVLGTPFCGKGEPNQIMRVGHASPACRFREVDVFGGVGD